MASKNRQTNLDPGETTELYKALELIEVDFSKLAPKAVAEALTIIAENMSSQPINLLMSLLTITANGMDNSLVRLHKGHIRKIIVWCIPMGMRGSNKSGCLEFSLLPLLAIETSEQETNERNYRLAHAEENVGKNPKEKKRFDRRQSQRIVQTSTFAGLEEVLFAKSKNEDTAAVIIVNDEISVLLSSLNSDATFEASFLSMFSGSTIKKNTKQGGYLEVKNPFIQVVGFSQPDTILADYSRKEDTGGKYDRFIFSYGKLKYKDLSKEGLVDPLEIMDIDTLLRTIIMTHKGQGAEYVFTTEAREETNNWLLEENKKNQEESPYSGLEGGLRGKAIPKIMSVSSVLSCLENALDAIKPNDDGKKKTDEEKKVIMSKHTVDVSHVKSAISIVEQSNKIHRLLDSFKSKVKFPNYKKTAAMPGLYSDISNPDVSMKKIMTFSDKIASIFQLTPKLNQFQVLVKDIRGMEFFPQGLPKDKSKHGREKLCLFFLKCLEVKGFLKISSDNKLVDLLCSEDPVPMQLSDVLQELKAKYPEFALPSNIQEDDHNKSHEDSMDSDEDN